MSWTDDRVELLKKMWGEGQSASQIAKELGGVTRNAVIGKVHRLGLSNRTTGAAGAAPKGRAQGQARPQGRGQAQGRAQTGRACIDARRGRGRGRPQAEPARAQADHSRRSAAATAAIGQ